MDSTTTTNPLYTPLDPLRSQIRLIAFDPPISTSRGNILNLRLRKVSLDRNPAFLALSYVWGDPSDKVDIVVNGTAVSVTRTLEAALRQNQEYWEKEGLLPYSRGLVWADAISINQEDTSERESQLMLMSRIYRCASLVVAWLGNDYRDVFAAFERLCSELLEINWHVDDSLDFRWMRRCRIFRSPEIWDRIYEFLEDPYWTRIWILQELVLGSERIRLLTRTAMCRWETISSVAVGLDAINKRACSNASLRLRMPKATLHRLSRPGAFRWSSIVFPAMLQGVNCVMDNGPLSLDSLRELDRLDYTYGAMAGFLGAGPYGVNQAWLLALEIASNYQATDPRDYIYGLLAATRLDPYITPNYSSTTTKADAYIQFAAGFLEGCRNMERWKEQSQHPLRFLIDAGVGRSNHDSSMPTWVPNFARKTGEQQTVPPRFTSADKNVFRDNPRYARIAENKLHVDGVVVQKVEAVEAAMNKERLHKIGEGNNPLRSLLVPIRAYRLRSSSAYATGMPILQAWCRVVALDEFPPVDKSSIEVAFWFFYGLLSCDSNGPTTPLYFMGYPADWSAIRKGEEPPPALSPKEVESFFIDQFFPGIRLEDFGLKNMVSKALMGNFAWYNQHAKFSSFWIHRLATIQSDRLVLTDGGFLGWGPGGTQKGDVVCILKDCGFPVILRRVESHYVFVGAAFVLGLMDGEARRFIDQGTAQVESFEIR